MKTRSLLRGRRARRGQSMVEVVIIFGVVGLAVAWVTAALPAAISKHYVQSQNVVASPL